MAIGGYSWEEVDRDWQMMEGVGPDAWDTFFTVRMEFHEGICVNYKSVRTGVRIPLELIDQKLALLRVAPPRTKVPGVGWRRSESIFYLHIYESDLPLGEYR